jgi:EAL domain-containing protein (putative c-di-GMP-specific phosphodiesterase class I)
MSDAVQSIDRAAGDRARPAPTGAAKRAPLCYVVDQEPGVRRFVSAVLDELGLKVAKFDNGAPMLESALRTPPDIIFVDFGLSSAEWTKSIDVLCTARIGCPVQLMSGLNAILVEDARRSGERRGLRMLPVLTKPLRREAIRQVVDGLKLRRDLLSTQKVPLIEVLKNGSLELWYQPKADLASKRLVGAEAFVRARHPDHGALPPECFLDGASEADLLTLTEHVLLTTLRDGRAFADFGAPMTLSINVPVSALAKLPIVTIVREERPKNGNWPGLILEITEDEIIPDVLLAHEIAKVLQPLGVGIAVDDFGAAYGSLVRMKDLPFVELKIDRSYVADCNIDRVSAGLCESVIELAHRFGIKAVGEGIETRLELKTLADMGCDLGQGFLFARPMQREKFAVLVQHRLDSGQA